ncbi:2-oxo acid dehydrogenase subunit E2 [Actinomycetes bacterium KLBMP 9759]
MRAAAEKPEAVPAEEAQPDRPLAKPPVRKLARDLGVELAEVRASGPNGVVTREDVRAARERAGRDEAVEREVAALQALVDVEIAEIPAKAQEPAAKEPASLEPASLEPASLEPASLEPAFREPVSQEPVGQEPVVQDLASQEPTVQEPVAQDSVAQEPVAQEPVAQEPAAAEPVPDRPTAEEPVEEAPVVEEPVAGTPAEAEEALPAGVLDTLSAAYPAGPATDLMISWSTVSSVSQDEGVRRVPVTGVRKATARAMVTSAFTAPHVTEFVTVDVTRTMKLVASLKEDPVFAGVRVGPLLIVAKALLVAVSRNPGINAAWDEERQEILHKDRVNLGIAAATPRGLIVPNIPDAGRFTLRQLAGEMDQLVSTARAGRTQPGAMRDGTITITNIGVFGVDTGTPILNPGESAILAFGAVKELPWVHRGQVRPRKVTTLALSFDHRVVDGELGSHVLSDVAAILERPKRLFAWT